MPKCNQTEAFLKKWLPDPTVPDQKCNLLEIWSRYHTNIKQYRKFSDNTEAEYTISLKQIEEALANSKPVGKMDAFDVWTAVSSADTIPNGKRAGEPYSASAIEKRLSVIHDIYMYMEYILVCSDILHNPPWKLYQKDSRPNYKQTKSDIIDNLNRELDKAAAQQGKKLLLKSLRNKAECALMRLAMKHIAELNGDEPWLALATGFYEPTRLTEVCGLDLGDFKPFSDPERCGRCFIEIGRSVGYKSTEAKAGGKTKQSIRRIPEHIELFNLRQMFIKALKCAGVADIESVPVAYSGNPGERFMPAKLSVFIRTQLSRVLTTEEYRILAIDAYLNDDEADDKEDDDYTYSIDARILRRNAITKLTTETPLDPDSQIRPISGHKSDNRYPFRFTEDELWNMMRRMDHRMVLPELHGETWVTRLSKECSEASVSETVRQEIVLPKELMQMGGRLNIDVDTDSPGDAVLLEFIRKLPPGCKIQEEHYYTEDSSRPVERAITDSVHWKNKKWTDDD